MISPKKLLQIGIVIVGGLAAPVVGGAAFHRVRTSTVRVRYHQSPRLRRSLVRDVDYDGVVHINRYGFRGADFDSVKGDGTTRVMIVGASTTFDSCARHDSETWPARLEYWLTQLAPGHKFQVINAGVPGAAMVDQIIRLQTELYAFEPDVYVIYANHGIVSASDAGLGSAESANASEDTPTLPSWDRWLRGHSRFYDRVRSSPSSVANDLSARQWQLAVNNADRNFMRDLTSFTLIARSQGAHVIFAEINRVTGGRAPSAFTAAERTAWQHNFATPPEVVHAGYERFHATWRAVADSVGATFIPIDSVAISGPLNYCPQDAIHFSTAGAEAMGHRMAELLITDGIADR